MTLINVPSVSRPASSASNTILHTPFVSLASQPVTRRRQQSTPGIDHKTSLFRSGEKLLIFTESKNTLDYLLENLAGWGLSTTHTDGTMAPPARYRAEQDFRSA